MLEITKLQLNISYIDGSNQVVDVPIKPTPILVPPAPPKYVMLNCINWGSLDALPDASEYTYFVLPVSSKGLLLGQNDAQEKKFVADVHAKGKKATFSIAGGAQNVADITAAVTQKTNLINNIHQHMTAYGYDGVVLDIENTNIPAQVFVDFVIALRAKLGANAIIGCYTQPYQLDTVHAKTQLAPLTWLSPMLYDFPNTTEQFKANTLKWLPKVGNDKKKLLAGTALNYDATGLDLNELPIVLDWINTEGLGGIGIWQNTIYTKPYQDIVKAKLS